MSKHSRATGIENSAHSMTTVMRLNRVQNLAHNMPATGSTRPALSIDCHPPMSEPESNSLRLMEATADDLDRIMELERNGFADGTRELRATYAQRIATFPQGSMMAWLGADCVGCVFSEIWRATPQPDVTQFTLGHDIRERHDAMLGTELYISSMTLAPAVRGRGLGASLLLGCISHVAKAFPALTSALLLVNANWSSAHRLYSSAGFAEVSRLDGFFRTPGRAPEVAIVMRRPIKL
jgi:ribosomal protein S18 acetylase RimI-like enzyme